LNPNIPDLFNFTQGNEIDIDKLQLLFGELDVSNCNFLVFYIIRGDQNTALTSGLIDTRVVQKEIN